MKELLPKIDSQDGQFHNGNPATGEQGTRVTDTWLNNVQAHLRDIGEELKFLLSKAGLMPIANKTTQIYDAIVAIINANRRNGSVSAKGEIQLTNDTGLDSEVLGLSAKGAKKLAQEIAQNRINVNKSLNEKVDKTAVSDAVNSDSKTNVANSKAVKTAYDKAVDGVNRANNAQNTANDAVNRANNAQTKANQADNNANGRVSKSGDVIQWLNIQREHAWLTINSMNYGDASVDFMLHNTRHSQVSLQAVDIGNYSDELRILTTPKGNNYESDRRRHTFTFNPEGHIWSLGYGWLHDYFVKKSGDRMTGDLELKSDDWSSVKLFNTTNHYLRLEVAPDRDPNFGCLIYHDGQNRLHRLLLPKKTGTLATVDDIKSTYRKDYSRTINGTSTWDNGTSKSIQLDGSVTVYPDGRIVQVLHLKNFRIFWFQVEELYGLNGNRHPLISLPLWTTMPTKILSVTPQLVQATTAGNTPSYVGEAGEWISAWALRKQGNDKNNIYVNTRRFVGDGDEVVDLYVVVEGY